MNFLTDEQPMVVIPELAAYFGVKPALLLFQLHKNLQESGQQFDQQRWYCQSYENWQTQLPFLHLSAIKHLMKDLKSQGLVLATDRFNQSSIDRTNWYTINYTMLDVLTGVTKDKLDNYIVYLKSISGGIL